MEKNRSPLLTLVVLGLVTSVIMVSTMFLKLPTLTGYIHLGDGVIYAASLALGPFAGAVSAALGSALADVLGGYPAWAPWTFAIKGIAGYIVGKLGYGKSKMNRLVAMSLASLWIVAGYAAGTAFMYSPMAVWGEILGNLVQTGSGIVIGSLLGPVLQTALGHQNHRF